jgi:hypothetical protein
VSDDLLRRLERAARSAYASYAAGETHDESPWWGWQRELGRRG